MAGYVNDENILESSDVYELLQDISNKNDDVGRHCCGRFGRK
jgi:hypothetical protein